MKQLQMIRKSAPVKKKELPENYRFVPFRGTEEEIRDWVEICRNGLLSPEMGREMFEALISSYQDLVPENDLFFVVNEEGKRVATTAAVIHRAGNYDPLAEAGSKIGYLHMVGSLPEIRGLGIGKAMVSKAIQRFEEEGCVYSFLTTDDFRIPAIKSYLEAGFWPITGGFPEQEERWDAVMKMIGK